MFFLWAIGVVLAVAAGWGIVKLRRVAAIGAAYKAKVLCSLVFVSGRDAQSGRVEDVWEDSYWPMRILGARVDHARQSVTASLLGLQPRTAIYQPGLGATLTDWRSTDTPRSPAPLPSPRRPLAPSRDWETEETPPALEKIVAAAFTEPHPKRLRRTRAIVIVRDGRIIAERYAPGFTDKTPMPGWSITKSVMGTLIGLLVKDGRLALGDSALLPEWQPPDPRAAITLEDLLRMRSGLRFTEVYSDFTSDVLEMLFNRPDTAAYAAQCPLEAPPGSTWRYSGGTTNILSAIARRVVGDAEYPTWPRRALFDPLGMTSAVMEPDAAGTFVASSFMFATARDWARYGQLQLQRGQWDGRVLLPSSWIAFGTSPTPQSPEGVYGAHWWRKLAPELGGASAAAARLPDDVFFAIGHEAQTLSIVPSRGVVAIRLGLSVHIDTWNQASFLADVLDALA